MHFIFVQLSALVLTVNKTEPFTCLSVVFFLKRYADKNLHHFVYRIKGFSFPHKPTLAQISTGLLFEIKTH